VRRVVPGLPRYLRAKARALGLERLAWFDVTAPMGDGGGGFYTWTRPRRSSASKFGTFSPRMHGLADRSFREALDRRGAEPGKRGRRLLHRHPSRRIADPDEL